MLFFKPKNWEFLGLIFFFWCNFAIFLENTAFFFLISQIWGKKKPWFQIFHITIIFAENRVLWPT